MSLQLNLTGAGVLTSEESGGGGVAGDPYGAGVCLNSAADIDRVDRSGRMEWGSGTMEERVFGQCVW